MPSERPAIDIGRVQTYDFALSPDNPIEAMVNVHPSKATSSFDMHYVVELGIILRGKMRRYSPDWQADLGPGDVWFGGIWEPHGYRITQAPCEVAVMLAWPQALGIMSFAESPQHNWLAPFLIPPAQRPRARAHARKRMLELGRKLKDLLAAPSQSRRKLWIRLLLFECLLTLQEDLQETEDLAAPADAQARIEPALRLALGSRKRVTEQQAAAACRMSRNSFNAHFAARMGLTFAKFALRFRLSGAASQLLQTTDPIKTVAYAWGFADGSHLCHSFARHYGCSPEQYRQRDGWRGGAAIMP